MPEKLSFKESTKHFWTCQVYELLMIMKMFPQIRYIWKSYIGIKPCIYCNLLYIKKKVLNLWLVVQRSLMWINIAASWHYGRHVKPDNELFTLSHTLLQSNNAFFLMAQWVHHYCVNLCSVTGDNYWCIVNRFGCRFHKTLCLNR